MSSKFNCFKIQTNSEHTKETKLQKYLKERNEKLLEKCFNIKVEKPKNEEQNSNNDKLPQQPISRETDEQLAKNISTLITNSSEKELQESEIKEEKKSALSLQIMDPNKCTKSLAKSTKQRPKTAPNRSAVNSTSLKPSGNRSQTARSPAPTNWKSPFTSFTTTGIRSRLHPKSRETSSSEFAYDLSRDELKFVGKFSRPMKPLPEAERQLLNNGLRKDYLMQRYEHSPVVKYNYPEATSWRIGWLQQKQ